MGLAGEVMTAGILFLFCFYEVLLHVIRVYEMESYDRFGHSQGEELRANVLSFVLRKVDNE